MNIKLLDSRQVENVYKDYMINDFPKVELKPLSMIENNITKGRACSYGIFDENDEMVGYSFFMMYKNIVLLDYFATIESKRGTGIGSKALKLITEFFEDKYDAIIIESEDVKFAKNEQDRIIRQRRLNFYEKCGYLITQISSKVYTVEYSIFKNNANISDDDLTILLFGLYSSITSCEKAKANCFITMKNS